MNAITEPNPTERHATIKLGIDAHAKWFYVARQLDGAAPQPVQKMTLDGLLRFVAKQQGLAREVFTCYEASVEVLSVATDRTSTPVSARRNTAAEARNEEAASVRKATPRK